jgi:hypothetical protein
MQKFKIRSRHANRSCISYVFLRFRCIGNPSKQCKWDPIRNPYITRERLHSNKMDLTLLLFYQDRTDIMVNRVT